MGTALEDLRRVRKILAVLTRHGFSEVSGRVALKVGLIRKGRRGRAPDAGDEEDEERGAGERSKLPPQVRLRMVLEDLGPTFIKLGQMLSTRHDLLPMSYIEELSKLQDRVDPLPFDEIRDAMEAGLGRPVDEVFQEVDPDPLAAASIAQVHTGVLHDGTPVVIKVQRPGTGRIISGDMDLLYALARILDATVEEAKEYDPVGIVVEFERALREELDYRREAANMEAFRRNFESVSWLVVPRCYREASAKTVLTQERLFGRSLQEVLDSGDLDRELLSHRIIETAYKMIFQDGLFHADPHPGNIMVLEDGRMALIDYGLVGRVSPQMRESMVRLALGIFTRDTASLARFFYRLGAGGNSIDLHAFRNEIEDLLDRYLSVRLQEIDTRSLLSDLFEVAVRYRIQVPTAYALLVKAGATIEGIVRAVAPDMDLEATARPYIKRILAERYGPEELSVRATRLGVNLAGLLQDMPLEIEQVLLDLQTGRMEIQVGSEDIRQLSDRINGLGSRVFLGLMAAATLVSTTMVFLRFPVEVLGPRPEEWIAWVVGTLVAIGVGVVVSLVVTATTWHLMSVRFSKLRVRSILAFWRWLFGKRRE